MIIRLIEFLIFIVKRYNQCYNETVVQITQKCSPKIAIRKEKDACTGVLQMTNHCGCKRRRKGKAENTGMDML